MSDPSKRIQDLAFLHPIVREKVRRIQEQLDAEGIPLRVFESYRTPARQNSLYAKGRNSADEIVSKKDVVSYQKAWGSYHQYGLAVDFVFYENNAWNWGPKGSAKHKAWYRRLHEIGDSLGLEHLKFETPHLQLAGWSSTKLRKGEIPAGGDRSWAENLLAVAREWKGSPASPDFDSLGITPNAERPPMDEMFQSDDAAAPATIIISSEETVPAGAGKSLQSRAFAGNAALEAVASGHRILRASGGKIEGVAEIQTALNLLSVQDPAYGIATNGFAGYFGQRTERAVKAFQEDYRLIIDGQVGEETIDALDAAILAFERNPQPALPPANAAVASPHVYEPSPVNGALLSAVKFGAADSTVGRSLLAAYGSADRDPSSAKGDPSNCKALLKFPDGTVFFDAKMAICADGSPRAKEIDPGPGNPKTAFTYPGTNGAYFNAEDVPYIVLPGKNPGGSLDFTSTMGISKLDLAVLIHRGKVTPAFYGEVGPWFRIGEGSIKAHENLPVRNPWTSSSKTKIRNASVEGDVLCFVFPNSAVRRTTGMGPEEWLQATLATALQRWESFLANQ